MDIKNKTIASMKAIALDSINKAEQGHIGMAIGAAHITYSLVGEELNFSSKNSKWINRDRFVMSAGHGSMAHYSILHFMKLLSLKDMQSHKQLYSKTPSHPEIDANKYVDASTGPLGQGLAMGVGMAISNLYLQKKFNTSKYKIFDHKIFVLVGDGCLQEGVGLESIQLAGTMQLKDLIIIQDYNGVQIDSKTKDVNNANTIAYFKSQNFCTYDIKSEDTLKIVNTIKEARKNTQPTFIRIHTLIAKDTNYENTTDGHNGTLTKEETQIFKKKLGLKNTKIFSYDEDVYQYCQKLLAQKNKKYDQYLKLMEKYKNDYPKKFKNLNKLIKNDFKYDFLKIKFKETNVATRNYFIPMMNELENKFNVVGGSADLFKATKIGFNQDLINGGQNIKYGVREFSMSAINNGIFLHSNIRTIDSTFLTFADYAKPAYRLGSLMEIPSVHVLTHDSYQVGGDGPTHQPFEQLAMLRAIHNAKVIRIADETEMKYAFQYAFENKNKQIFIIGCRQPIRSFNKINKNLKKMPSAYFIKNFKDFDVTILASGSEVSLAYESSKKLEEQNIKARVISVPILNDFIIDQKYISKLNIAKKPILILEASNDSMWFKLSSLNKFDAIFASGYGYSAPGDQVYELKGFNVNNVIKKTKKLLNLNI